MKTHDDPLVSGRCTNSRKQAQDEEQKERSDSYFHGDRILFLRPKKQFWVKTDDARDSQAGDFSFYI
jgi:hypothetical protein